MKTNAPALYPNEKVSERVTAYSQEHSTPLPKHITEYHAWVDQNHERSGYMSSNFQSQFHVLLSQLIGAKRGMRLSPNERTGHSLAACGGQLAPDCEAYMPLLPQSSRSECTRDIPPWFGPTP